MVTIPPSRLSHVTFVSVFQFHVYLPWVDSRLSLCLNSVFNVKVLGPFNQEKALVGDFSEIVKANGSFAALMLGLRTGTNQKNLIVFRTVPRPDSEDLLSAQSGDIYVATARFLPAHTATAGQLQTPGCSHQDQPDAICEVRRVNYSILYFILSCSFEMFRHLYFRTLNEVCH